MGKLLESIINTAAVDGMLGAGGYYTALGAHELGAKVGSMIEPYAGTIGSGVAEYGLPLLIAGYTINLVVRATVSNIFMASEFIDEKGPEVPKFDTMAIGLLTAVGAYHSIFDLVIPNSGDFAEKLQGALGSVGSGVTKIALITAGGGYAISRVINGARLHHLYTGFTDSIKASR